MRRLLIYSQDGLGLGHLRRAYNIAREIVARSRGCSILIIADSPAVPFFPPLPGTDYLRLPTIVKTGASKWRTGSLSLTVENVLRFRSRVILEAFNAFEPDAVLVDHMPLGAQGELKPLLERAASSRKPPRLFLGLRDILDAPNVIRRVWSRLDAYDYLSLYDTVFVYGCRNIYDAESVYGLTPSARRVEYCHYVATRTKRTPPAVAPDERFVVVTGGGGGDAFFLSKALIDALATVDPKLTGRVVLFPGPNMPRSERRALAKGPRSARVEVRNQSEDAAVWVRSASAVVTMAGYNSLCEVLRWRRKALVVPRAGPSAEQRIRSRLFAERGLLRAVDPETVTPARLAEELTSLLKEPRGPDPAAIPPLDGAARTARSILTAVPSPSQRRPKLIRASAA